MNCQICDKPFDQTERHQDICENCSAFNNPTSQPVKDSEAWSKEPWITDYIEKDIAVIIRQPDDVDPGHYLAEFYRGVATANAKRTVDCVNAFQGIENPAEYLEHLRRSSEHGKQWEEDSSLEKWFPFTAEELDSLRAELSAAKPAIEFCAGTTTECLTLLNASGFPTLTHLCSELQSLRAEKQKLEDIISQLVPSIQPDCDALIKIGKLEGELKAAREEVARLHSCGERDLQLIKDAANLTDAYQRDLGATRIALAQAEKQRDELRWYVRHHYDCAIETNSILLPVPKCTCGLDEILKGQVI
jgi:hypothetical protein